MAGSIQNFIYYFDPDIAVNVPTAQKTVIRLDESNCRALGVDPPASLVGAQNQPAGVLRFEPRYIYWIGKLSNGNLVRRKLVVPTFNNTFYQNGGNLTLPVLVGDDLEQVAGYISGAVGEKRTFYPPGANTDTGLTDKTNP